MVWFILFFFLDVVLLGYKVLDICNFTVKIMDITFRAFTAKISVLVFQLILNVLYLLLHVLLDCFLLVILTRLLPFWLGLMLVWNCSTVTKHGAQCCYCLQLLKLCSLDFIFFCNNLLNIVVWSTDICHPLHMLRKSWDMPYGNVNELQPPPISSTGKLFALDKVKQMHTLHAHKLSFLVIL